MPPMNILIVYDSLYGNTLSIAEIIRTELSRSFSVTFINIEDFSSSVLSAHDLMLIGAPTHGFRAKQETIDLLEGLSNEDIRNYHVASFDTRIELSTIKNPVWRWMVNKGGYASSYINTQLKKKGAKVIMKPMGFLVNDKEGPLASGEIDKAKHWANELKKVIESQSIADDITRS